MTSIVDKINKVEIILTYNDKVKAIRVVREMNIGK